MKKRAELRNPAFALHQFTWHRLRSNPIGRSQPSSARRLALPTSLNVPAGLPGCSCQALTQATIWIATDAPSRRPASPRATFIQPRSTKSCKWECLLCHPVIFGHFKAAVNDWLTRVFLFFPDPNKGKKKHNICEFFFASRCRAERLPFCFIVFVELNTGHIYVSF